MRRVSRQQRVLDRCDKIVEALEDRGPMEISVLAKTVGFTPLRTRYALRLLRQDRRVYVLHYKKVVGIDGVERLAAVMAAGEGEDDEPHMELDFASTIHLQPIYVAWANTRTPDWRLDPSYQQT